MILSSFNYDDIYLKFINNTINNNTINNNTINNNIINNNTINNNTINNNIINNNIIINNNNNNIINNYCEYYIKLCTIIFDYEQYSMHNIYYKIDIFIKYNNNNNNNNNKKNNTIDYKFINPLYTYSSNTEIILYVYKNSLSDLIIYYLKSCDYELQLYCNDIFQFRKLLIIFLYHLNENLLFD